MRKTLFAAVALAPLWLLAAQSPASAQTTINNSTSTTAETSVDGDISIGSGGSIKPTVAGGEAVLVNSQNNVNNGGTISYSNLNSVAGILIQGVPAPTSSTTGVVIQNTATLTVQESYTAKDTNGDGVNEAPFASPTSADRFGIQLANGAVPFDGSISNSGTLGIQGDNSYGISIESPLSGSLTNGGTITYVGDGGAGIRSTAAGSITGSVVITDTITATGSANSQTSPILGSNGAVLGGSVGGAVEIYSSITSSGYGLTTRTTSPTALQTIENTTSEVMQGGSALVVMGGVGAGIFISAPPATTNSNDDTTDADGDGVVDSGEATGSITTYGAAPALVIGAANGQTATYGGFVATTSTNANNGASLIIEGTVTSSGVYDRVPATGVQIGGNIDGTGAGTTIFTGPIRVVGSVSATAYAADATAIHVGTGATLPQLQNSGEISATVSPPSSTSDTTIPAFGSINSPIVATAVQIDAGSTLTSLVNSGAIAASVTGDANDVVSAAGVLDKGGGLSSVTNTGSITASFVADATGATVNGTPITLANGTTSSSGAVALDLSANKTGVTLTQDQAPNQIVTTTVANGVTTVAVSTGAVVYAATPTQVAVATTTTPSSGVTVVTTTPAAPTIVGDIYLGSGNNTVNILAGSVTGALDMGAGATGTVTINNGAEYVGAFTYTGAALSLNVENGIFSNTSAAAGRDSGSQISNAAYHLSSLNVGPSGQLFFGVDPVNSRAADFIVSGAATFAAGAKIGLNFLSNTTEASETFTLLQANTLNIGETSTALTGAIPFMFNATISANPATGTITATVSQKTPAEMGLNPSQSAALPAVYNALTLDKPLQAEFLGQFTKAGFLGVYNQVLPDYAGGTFQAANAASLAIGRATSEANDIENPTGSRGAWVQEVLVGVNQGEGQTDGFRGGGFGFVGGVETGGSGLGAFGVTTAFVGTSITDPHLPGDTATSMSELELGGYWQGEFSGLVADARVGAGYLWMAGRREFIETDSAGDITIDRKVKSNWDGYTLSGRFGLSYRWEAGSHVLGGGWFLQPQAHVDYFRLNESAYSDNEAQGGPAFSLAYDSRTGQETSGTASVIFGRKLGTGLIWRPSVELGVRDVFEGDAGDTTARFISGGPAFTLSPADITGVAGIARLKVKASSEYYEIGVEAGGEALSSRYEEADFKLSARVLF